VRGHGLALRIAIAALLAASLGLAILVVGVLVVGANLFESLMLEAGETADSAAAMFETSVTQVVVVSAAVAATAALVASLLLGRWLARPLAEVATAARRIAGGDYATRVESRGPAEVDALATSFNAMAAALEDQERMRREFIANAAHELRTPLTNLQGYLEALRDGVITADRAVYVSLWEEADRLVRLSRALDVLADADAAGESRPLRTLDLAAHVRAALALATPALELAGLSLDVDLPERLPALAEPDRLKQVLDNLLSNAIRYTPRTGHVTVSARQATSDARVTITNTGDAIPAQDLVHVFERFYRVEKSRDSARGGAGIGLAIVRQLVESMGGSVGAVSSDGLTSFWFTLKAPPTRGAS